MSPERKPVSQLNSLLYRDELHNMVPISSLHQLEQIQVLTDDASEPHAALIMGDASPGSWDAFHFPTSWRRVAACMAEKGTLAEILDALPREETYLFKMHDSRIFGEARRHFELEGLCRLVYMTITADRFHAVPHDHVVPLLAEQPQTLEVLKCSGRTQADLDRHPYVQGFGVWRDDRLVSCAFAMQKTEHVAEVCGVYTSAAHRQAGLGASTVSAAVQHILDRGWIPCYGTRENNAPSLRLAKNLGFWYYQDVVYYVAQRLARQPYLH